MKNAFNLIRTNIGEKVTVNFLLELHDIVVESLDGAELGISFGNFYYIKNPIDPVAIIELIDSMILLHPQTVYQKISDGKNIVDANCSTFFLGNARYSYLSIVWDVTNGFKQITNLSNDHYSLTEKLEPLIFYYYDQMNKLQTLKGKIAAIAELIRALEVAHIFEDGARQVYSFLLLNKLLIENNIPPAILEEADIFNGGCTLETMVYEIYKGVLKFLKISAIQQSFKNLECDPSNLDSSAIYFGPSDYFPYHKRGLGNQMAMTLRARFRREIQDSIRQSMYNDVDEVLLPPIGKAIIIADFDLVEELLFRGANVIFDSYFNSPLTITMRFFNNEIARKVVSSVDLNSTSSSHLEYALIGVQVNSKYHDGIIRQQLRKCLELLVFSRAAFLCKRINELFSELVTVKVKERFLDDFVEPRSLEKLSELAQKCKSIDDFISEYEGENEAINDLISKQIGSLYFYLIVEESSKESSYIDVGMQEDVIMR